MPGVIRPLAMGTWVESDPCGVGRYYRARALCHDGRLRVFRLRRHPVPFDIAAGTVPARGRINGVWYRGFVHLEPVPHVGPAAVFRTWR